VNEIRMLRNRVDVMALRLGEGHLTQPEAATRLGVSGDTVYRYAKEGKLTRYGSVKRPRYDAREVEALILKRTPTWQGGQGPAAQ
jgi:excisionase family DNA binding protein